jgi:alpha/beta superfamily hydrolase
VHIIFKKWQGYVKIMKKNEMKSYKKTKASHFYFKKLQLKFDRDEKKLN